jgi:hypothetical protein
MSHGNNGLLLLTQRLSAYHLSFQFVKLGKGLFFAEMIGLDAL